jgi:hypothetical protein
MLCNRPGTTPDDHSKIDDAARSDSMTAPRPSETPRVPLLNQFAVPALRASSISTCFSVPITRMAVSRDATSSGVGIRLPVSQCEITLWLNPSRLPRSLPLIPQRSRTSRRAAARARPRGVIESLSTGTRQKVPGRTSYGVTLSGHRVYSVQSEKLMR